VLSANFDLHFPKVENGFVFHSKYHLASSSVAYPYLSVERLSSIVWLFGFPFCEGLFNKASFRVMEDDRAEWIVGGPGRSD
jgi:hypothetical protein